MAPIGDIVATFFVIGLFSFIYRDNLWYKFAEYTFIGIAMGITITMAYWNVMNQTIGPIINNRAYIFIPALILGVLILFRVSKTYGWVSRASLAVMFATTMAVRVMVTIQSQVVQQILPAMNAPILNTDPITGLSNLFALTGLAAACFYFVFTRIDLPPALQKPSDWFALYGRYVIMAFLGASYANVMTGRVSMFIERILFICRTFGIA